MQCGAGAADEAGGEEGVSAEVEEVVVDGDAVDAEYFGEEGAEDFFAGARGLRPVVVGV